MIFRKSLLIVLIVFPFSFININNLNFYREDLKFEIKDNYFILDGIYYFYNSGDKKINQNLFYPFPTDSLNYGDVDSISIVDIEQGNKNCLINKNKNGALFVVSVVPYGAAKYRIFYRQKLLKNKAEYILTTTRNWDKPLEIANYSLTVKSETKNINFSYQPDSSKLEGNSKIFYWSKKNFMPEKNMVFEFK